MATHLLALALGGMLAAQTGGSSTPASQPAQPDGAPPSITLSGCVARDTTTRAGGFTLSDPTTGGRYRLTGKSMRKYAGQRVEIVGTSPQPKVAVRGGLVPSPNAAAQAGALDPVQAAIAAAPGGTSSSTGGDVELPEFKVERVRAVPGKCE